MIRSKLSLSETSSHTPFVSIALCTIRDPENLQLFNFKKSFTYSAH